MSGTSGETGGAAGGPLGRLLNLLLDDKTGLGTLTESPEAKELKEQTEAMTREAVAGLTGK